MFSFEIAVTHYSSEHGHFVKVKSKVKHPVRYKSGHIKGEPRHVEKCWWTEKLFPFDQYQKNKKLKEREIQSASSVRE